MPGAPANPAAAPSFGGFNLPGPGPNTAQQAGNALGQLPGMLNQQQADKYALQEQKARAAEAEAKAESDREAAGINRLKFYYRMYKSAQESGAAINPELQQAADKTAKDLGLGTFSHIDPTSGQPIMDWDAVGRFATTRTYDELSEPERQDVWAATPGKQREGVVTLLGLDKRDVPKSILDMPAKIDPAKLSRMIEGISKHIQAVAAGGSSPEALNAIISIAGQELGKYDIDITQMTGIINSDQFKTDLSAGVKMQEQKLRIFGLDEASLRKFREAQMSLIPARLQNYASMISHRGVMENIAAGELAVHQSAAENTALGRFQTYNESVRLHNRLFEHLDALDADASSRVSQDKIKNWQAIVTRDQAALDNIVHQYGIEKGNGDIPSDELMTQKKQAQAQLDHAMTILQTLTTRSLSNPAARAAAASGKHVTPAKPVVGPPAPRPTVSGLPPGSKVGDIRRPNGSVIQGFSVDGVLFGLDAQGKPIPLDLNGYPLDSETP